MMKEILKLAIGVALGVLIANLISNKVPMLSAKGSSYQENLDEEMI